MNPRHLETNPLTIWFCAFALVLQCHRCGKHSEGIGCEAGLSQAEDCSNCRRAEGGGHIPVSQSLHRR